MKQWMSRASLAAVAALLVMGVAAPADAQKKGQKPASVKLSKPVQQLLAQAQPMLVKAQTASAAKDETTAMAEARAALGLVEQAAALPNLTADDMFVIHQMRLNAGILSKEMRRF